MKEQIYYANAQLCQYCALQRKQFKFRIETTKTFETTSPKK